MAFPPSATGRRYPGQGAGTRPGVSSAAQRPSGNLLRAVFLPRRDAAHEQGASAVGRVAASVTGYWLGRQHPKRQCHLANLGFLSSP